jgi:hypothetical protein
MQQDTSGLPFILNHCPVLVNLLKQTLREEYRVRPFEDGVLTGALDVKIFRVGV